MRTLCLLIAVFCFGGPLFAEGQESGVPEPGSADATNVQPAPPEVFASRYHAEGMTFLNAVSNGFGRWWGGGLEFDWKPSPRNLIAANVVSEVRPGQTEQLAGLRALVNWTNWFYTDTTVSGGGANNSAAFFPRFRYDLTANFKVPSSGLILNAGYTRLYFGSPVGGEVIRLGAVYYWRHFVFQGNGNLNTAYPGNQKSKSANGAIQYGQEGHYWLGASAGGGREAWQTLSLTPQDIQFTSSSGSVFLRKWINRAFGFAGAYNYSLKRTAYRINGLELRFFADF